MRLTTFAPLALALVGCTTGSEDNVQTISQAICPPPTTFQHAVCVCENLDHVGDLYIKPGPGGVGGVGVNGRTDLVGRADIAGEFIAWGGFASVGASIGESLVTPGNVTGVGDLHIGGNATIGGDLSCVGNIEIDGDLALGGTDRVVGTVTMANRTAYTAPAAPPCDCDPSTFFDVAGAVAAARQATNGNESWDHVGTSEMRLATGNYYVTSATVVGTRKIIVEGNASVFVDGSLSSVGIAQWELAPGATLDLFVSGHVASVGNLEAGNAADPSAFRLYIGGTGNVSVGAVGLTRLAGSIYAPQAIVAYVGDAQITGSIFARSIHGVGKLVIEYGDAGPQPTSCEPPMTDGDGGGDGTTDGGPVFL